MPVLAAMLYWWRILRRPLHPVLKRGRVGGFAVVSGGVALAGGWLAWRPVGMAPLYVGGEFAGVLAVYALTWAILTATRSPWLEQWFGGLDRMYRWHRRCAGGGVLLLVPHKLLLNAAPDDSAGAVGLALGVVAALGLVGLVVVSVDGVRRRIRLSYERWLQSHRLTGLLVLGAAVHGLLVDRVVATSPPLLSAYLLVVATAVVGYGYQLLLARRTRGTYRYRVHTVRRRDRNLVELDLRPSGRPIDAQPGQFVYLTLDEPRTAEHPLSVAGVEPDGGIRLTIKAAGDDTRRLHDQVRVIRTGGPEPRVGWPGRRHPAPRGLLDLPSSTSRGVASAGLGVAQSRRWRRAQRAALPFLPFAREQSPRHYAFHALYGALQLPVILVLTRTVRHHRTGRAASWTRTD